MNERGRETNDDRVFDSLARDLDAPDLTGRIMGRLGYSRAIPEARRRFSRRRLGARLALVAMAFCTIGVGLAIRDQSAGVRRADSMTVPGAIRNDRAKLRSLLQPFEQIAVPVRSLMDGRETDTGVGGTGEVIDLDDLSPFPVA